jgi:hypothetical protein
VSVLGEDVSDNANAKEVSRDADVEDDSMNPKDTKPPKPRGMGMPPMMQEIAGGANEFNPMAMCQAMMTSVSKSAEMAAYATPEVRTLFEEWAENVAAEVLAVLRTRGRVDLAELASALKISREGALFFLGRLVREGKATISGIEASGGNP